MTNILVVDDEESVRYLLSRMLLRGGYECALAADAAEARKFIKDQNFELILCDVNMPGESGIDFIGYVAAEYPDTATMMLTAVDDPKIVEMALDVGIYGYLIKPFNVNEVIINIRNSLRRRELEIADRTYRRNLEQKVEERTAELQKTLSGVIYALTMTVEYRDPYTAGHQQRVADLASTIAKEMGFPEDKIMGIRMAGALHDIGKIAVPVEILSKPGRLSKTEFELIKNHSQVGHDILNSIKFPWPLSQIILQHHERMDGSGYPNGLLGKEILIEARIIGVADVVEAMASHRPYRPALGIDKALEEVSINKVKLYDVKVVNACLKVFKDKGFKFK
ncbi:MAG: response regulator [Deltaproteobacteria bacterium]|jgi:putative nucleotidyltransferase with HDIG domain|nr:response regulator [Deltaproteobacteria bacterium]MDL1987740.1 response regulator [Deltaproteobacteria bacterium]